MDERAAIPAWVEPRISRIGKTDLVIGTPSFNNASTIGYVATVAAAGARKHFPSFEVVLVNADGGSTDGTQDVFCGPAAPPGIERIAFSYRGIPGKGSALKAIFEIAAKLDARACVVLDSDLRSVKPEWVQKLAGPIFAGFDFVSPCYIRHKHDGTITNNICYPLTRALYGAKIRQPIGGDFGVSRHLVHTYLGKDVWATDVARFGVDIFMTTTAIAESGRIAQAALGRKVHDAKDPAGELGPMFSQVVSTLFDMMIRYEYVWNTPELNRTAEIPGPETVGYYGSDGNGDVSIGGSGDVDGNGDRGNEPDPVPIDVPRLIASFRNGVREHREVLSLALGKRAPVIETIASGTSDAGLGLSCEEWALVVYDFAAAYRHNVERRSLLIKALVPLYNGRVASFVSKAREMSSRQAEELVEEQCRAFEESKPYLRDLWK